MAGSCRRVSVTPDDRFNHDISVTPDDHLRAGNYDISFKGHVKRLGAYIGVIVYSDHISRSAHLEIRRISSIRHLLATKATAQLMSSLVLMRLDYGNSLLVDINCHQMYSWNTLKATQRKLFFARALINILDPRQSASLAASQRKDYFQDSHLCFPFY